jgi:uncharacterized protein
MNRLNFTSASGDRNCPCRLRFAEGDKLQPVLYAAARLVLVLQLAGLSAAPASAVPPVRKSAGTTAPISQAPARTQAKLPAKAATAANSTITAKAIPEKPAKGNRLFLWKMTSGSGATVYFLGTIHVARSNFYPLADEIEKAFQKSKALLVEADISDKKIAESEEIQQKEYYPEGDSLDKHVSPATLRALQKYCAATDVPETRFTKMKPWLVSVVVEQLEMRRLGFMFKNGIDLHFINEAKKSGKKVITLEKEHYDVLSGMDADLQDKMLRLSLIGIDLAGPASLERLMKIWKAGDGKAMNEVMNRESKKEPELQPCQDRLLYDRNLKMADTIEPYLKGDGVYMVAVGSAHLVGDRSIIDLLNQRGYQTKQVLVGDEI